MTTAKQKRDAATRAAESTAPAIRATAEGFSDAGMTSAQTQAALRFGDVPDTVKAGAKPAQQPAKVYIVEAEHWSTPGRKLSAHSTKGMADARALVIVRDMLAEIKFPPQDGGWQSELDRLKQTLNGDHDVAPYDLPWVTVTAVECDLGNPEEEAPTRAGLLAAADAVDAYHGKAPQGRLPWPPESIAVPFALAVKMSRALAAAASFMSGFENDETQEEPIDDDLKDIREAGDELDALLPEVETAPTATTPA